MLKNIENIDPRVLKTKNSEAMLLSKRAISDSKKSRFLKEQEAKRLLSNLGLKNSINVYKMNDIVNKFLLAGDEFMPGMHLKQTIFTYRAWGSFTKMEFHSKENLT